MLRTAILKSQSYIHFDLSAPRFNNGGVARFIEKVILFHILLRVIKNIAQYDIYDVPEIYYSIMM